MTLSNENGVNVTDITFQLRYSANETPLDLEEIESRVPITYVQPKPTRRRANPFDASLHSDPTLFQTAQWVVSSGLAAGMLKLLRDVLIKHMETRRSYIEITVGKKKTSILAPLSRSEIDRIVKTLEPDEPE